MKMINGKPCMKCGGKVKYKGGGKLPIMGEGGTPPNCEPGYTPDPKDPTKCIRLSNLYGISVPNLQFPSTGSTTTLPPNVPAGVPTNMQNTGNTSGVNIWQPGWTNPINPTEQKPAPFNNTTIEGNQFNPFAQKMDPNQTGPQQKIGVEEYVLNNKKQTPQCKPGYIYDPKSQKCIKDVKIPGNVVLEKANTLVNNISNWWASNRDFNNYYNQQVERMNLRQPIPDWATNEQKGVPGYNTYFKKGGSINNKTNNMIKIKEENKGKFTAQANRAGMGVQEFASYVLGNPDEFTTSTVKRANFAKNAAGWKKEYGGMTMNNPYYGYYQDGGPIPMQQEQQAAPGGDQLQQIIQMIVEALQEGMSPQDILAALVKMGIPQDQATQLLQAVIEKMQGGEGQGQMQGQMQGEGMEQEEEGEYEEEGEQEGMQQQAAPMMGYGGKAMPNNEGFRSLPGYVQQKIMSNMQQGGSMGNQMNMLIQQYASIKGISKQEVIKMLQQQLKSVSPQQQDQALQSIMQNMQMEIKQAQEGTQAGQMEQEQGMMRMGGMHSNYYR